MHPIQPEQVKLLIAVLFSRDIDRTEVYARLETAFGPIDYTSASFPFDVTHYYEAEMGPGIERVLISFERLVDPSMLVALKLLTIRIEDEYIRNEARRVNLDVGYLDTHKLILASAKEGWQKIFLDKGVYADPTLYYRKGTFHPFEWGFPDFKSGRYNDALLEIRQIYKKQPRQVASPARASA